jgi:hypothetical protein
MLAYAIDVPCCCCFSAQTCAATAVVVLLELVLLGSVCCYYELLVQVLVMNFLTALGMVNWDFPPVLLAWSCAV